MTTISFIPIISDTTNRRCMFLFSSVTWQSDYNGSHRPISVSLVKVSSHYNTPTWSWTWDKTPAASCPLGSDRFSVAQIARSSWHIGLLSCCFSETCLPLTIWAAWSSELRNTWYGTTNYILSKHWPQRCSQHNDEHDWLLTGKLEVIICIWSTALENPWNDFFMRTVQLLQQATHLHLKAIQIIWRVDGESTYKTCMIQVLK